VGECSAIAGRRRRAAWRLTAVEGGQLGAGGDGRSIVASGGQ
jgi:hypothetical protein